MTWLIRPPLSPTELILQGHVYYLRQMLVYMSESIFMTDLLHKYMIILMQMGEVGFEPTMFLM